MNVYRVVIVDDESIIRRGFCKNIPWADNNFVVAGVAGDGEEGIELITSEKPDIVITDVKMPKVDGLEMIRRLKGMGTTARFIVISGYEEFEYVKTAINLDVDRYLLKPVDNGELLQEIKGLAQRIENDKKVRRQMKEGLSSMTQTFLWKLLSKETQNEEKLYSEMASLEIPFRSGEFAVLVVKVDDYFNKKYCGDVMEKELLKYAVYNISMELLAASFSAVAHVPEQDEFIAIVNPISAGEVSERDRIYEICHDICQKVRLYLNTTVTIGIGSFYNGLAGISRSYRDAAAAVECRHIFGKDRIIPIEDVKLQEKGAEFDTNLYEKKLVSEVRLSLTESALATLAAIKDKLQGESFLPLDSIRVIAVEIAAAVSGDDGGLFDDELAVLKKRLRLLSEKIFSQQTVQEIFELLSEFIVEMCSESGQRKVTQQKEIIDQAVSYIESNFGNENLSLQEVAKNIHVSISYLSTLFKKERNVNFSDFLTEVRMQKAKELLRNTSMKAYEVAMQVGYSNPQYFSMRFKQYTGYSPLRFKNV